jgi:hypothetical protein
VPATTEKPPTLAKGLAALDRMTAVELRDKYAAVFGEPTTAGNRAWLIRRVGWRLQALAEGDLSERARGRAAGRGDNRWRRVQRVRAPEPASGDATSVRGGGHDP